mmetsp:Transcript_26186/g.63347  ORF Transcript_26186/g.63347 Transcript_26186/m.63347 type:complete len:118 (+) Transcript_26186:174-527(+)
MYDPARCVACRMRRRRRSVVSRCPWISPTTQYVYKSHRGSHRAVVALLRRHALLSQHVWSDGLAHQQMNLIVLIRDAIYLHSAAACIALGAMDTFELQLSSNVSVFDHSLQQKKRSR